MAVARHRCITGLILELRERVGHGLDFVARHADAGTNEGLEKTEVDLQQRCDIDIDAVMHKAQVRLEAEKGSIEIEIAIEID
jgi:hypothetical protein